MMPATVYRASGLSLLLGSVVLISGAIIRVLAGADPANPHLATGWSIQAVGAMLVVLGLPGVYACQVQATGLLGLLGIVGTTLFFLIHGVFVGLLHGLVLPALATRAPDLATTAPPSVGLVLFSAALLGTLGSLLLGSATVRAGILPRWAGASIIVGGVAVFVGHGRGLHLDDAGLISLMVGLAGLGVHLLSAAHWHTNIPAVGLASGGVPRRQAGRSGL